MDAARVLFQWRERDLEVALSEDDRRAIDGCEGARANVVERSGATSRDLFHALAIYGRALAVAGASPTLAGATFDGLEAALGAPPPWRTAARSALAEGYASERADEARRVLLGSWAGERCVVMLGAGRAAIACAVPTHDPDELQAWADGVARKLSKARIRSVIVDREPPRALLAALDLAGIAVEPGLV